MDAPDTHPWNLWGGLPKDIEASVCFSFENFSKAGGLPEQSEPELE